MKILGVNQFQWHLGLEQFELKAGKHDRISSSEKGLGSLRKGGGGVVKLIMNENKKKALTEHLTPAGF